MPTPGQLLRHAARRADRAAASARSTRTSDVLRELRDPGRRRRAPRVPAADLPQGGGGALRRSRGGAVLLRDHPAQGRPGFGAGNFRALFESIEREQRRQEPLMLDRMRRRRASRAKHHIALRDAGGRAALRGVPHPRRLRRPVHHPLPPAPAAHAAGSPPRRTAGRSRRAADDERARSRKRHYRSQELARTGGPQLDARVAAAVQRRRGHRRSSHPDEADPVYFANGDGDELYLRPRRRRRAAHALGDLALRRGRLRVRPKGLLHRFLPDAIGAQHWLSIECAAGVRPAAPVAQRGRPAAHGRAVLPPRLPAAGVRRPARRRHARAGGEARRRVSRLPLRARAARRRRLGRHGLPVGVPDPELPAAGRARCTCRRPGTARSPRAAR